MINFDLNNFIHKFVTKRQSSLFAEDLEAYSEQLVKEIKGKSVLVIGGAGTIGSSFIRSLLRFSPAKLIVVDTNENGLTELTRDLRSRSNIVVPSAYWTYPLSFDDPVFLKIFKHHGPFEIVANFAAHKHVRSEKDQFSVEAMIRNNVLSAKRLLDCLKENPPKHFFCVSTDKAANPVNIMGASKKLMEDMIMAYSSHFKVTTARFANVAFSNGSLLAGYIERMMRKQPFSCPSDVKRYFVSPDESGEICLMACILGKTGEIFFPKLLPNQLTSFREITDAFISELGYTPKVCASEEEAKQFDFISKSEYPVYYFDSDTSGEKLFEEFYTHEDLVSWDQFRGMGVIANPIHLNAEHISPTLKKLEELFANQAVEKSDIVRILSGVISNFQHIETGKTLDSKM